MYLYTKRQRWDSQTGHLIDPIFSIDPNRVICDYTGEVINIDNQEEMPLYSLSFDYNHDSEPLWDQDAHAFEKKYGIDYSQFGEFLERPYHFQHTEEYGCADVTILLMEQWIKDLKSKTKVHPPLKGLKTLEQVLSHTRLTTLRRLLDTKTYTLEQLGFEEPGTEN